MTKQTTREFTIENFAGVLARAAKDGNTDLVNALVTNADDVFKDDTDAKRLALSRSSEILNELYAADAS
jgi:hypothetical protein